MHLKNGSTRSRADARVEEASRFALSALRASSSVFYWIDDSMAMAVEEMVGPCHRNFDLYRREMNLYDPLSVRRMVASGRKIATIGLDGDLAAPADLDRYRVYMRDSDIADVLDFIFRLGNVPVSGLGILKTPDDPPFCDASIDFARVMHPYIEFNLADHPRIRRQRVRGYLTNVLGLSRREVEVTELVCLGFTNCDVAEELGVSLGTVKTHALRIFQKVGVENRAALVAWVAQIGTVP